MGGGIKTTLEYEKTGLRNETAISVIISSYKPKDYLWECLNSLDKQTINKERYEVILVLNGCKEPYNSQIKRHIDDYKSLNIKYIQTDEGGVSNARNIGLDNARGMYVTFIDDDYVSPLFLQRLIEAANGSMVSLARPIAFYEESGEECNDYSISKTYNKYKEEGEVPLSKVRRKISEPCMKLIPMSFIQKRRFDKRFSVGEDSLFMFLISDKIKKVSFAKEDAIYYRRYRDGSLIMSHRSYKTRLFNQLKVFSTMLYYYISSFWRYNFKFLMLQLASVIKGIFR